MLPRPLRSGVIVDVSAPAALNRRGLGRWSRRRSCATAAVVLFALQVVAFFGETRAWLCGAAAPRTLAATHGVRASVVAVVARGGADELSEVETGQRFVGWLQHPVLTKSEKFDLAIEVGPGDGEGFWSISPKNEKRTVKPVFEGKCLVETTPDNQIMFKDSNTRIYGDLNGAGPGTVKGR